MSRCRWHVKDGIRFHVPECWGTVHDPDGPCYCPSSRVSLEDRLEQFAARLDCIEDKLNRSLPQ